MLGRLGGGKKKQKQNSNNTFCDDFRADIIIFDFAHSTFYHFNYQYYNIVWSVITLLGIQNSCRSCIHVQHSDN